MEHTRKHERWDPVAPISGFFELTREVTGEFRNREGFLIKNISRCGFNLVSNYPPTIGDSCQIFVNYGREKHEFTVRIVHSRIFRFQGRPEGVLRPGVVYSTGCEAALENEGQKDLILSIIRNDCGRPQAATPAC